MWRGEYMLSFRSLTPSGHFDWSEASALPSSRVQEAERNGEIFIDQGAEAFANAFMT